MIHRLFLFLTLSLPLFAQDGGQLFTLYCSACHGADGKGATGGAFPPLAASPWLSGDPDRAVKIVLNGLAGPVTVLGKTYNLEMPPQGAAMPDDQIAAILTYVRSSWGNQASPVTTEFVKTIRKSIADRKTSWTADEILKLHPLPLEKTALSALTSQVYTGNWEFLPDFKSLKAENIEEEHDGIISLKASTLRENFGIVWEAKLEVPTAGNYFFYLDTDDSGRVILDDEVILEVHGIGPMDDSRSQKSSNNLTQGPHRFRVEYFQKTGDKGISVGWRPASSKQWNWLSDQSGKKSSPTEAILIQPTNGRPVIYRNFIEGTSPRAIAIGFPGEFNLAYSADNLAPEILWTGNFINGTHKWLNRGTDNNPPAGTNIIKLSKTRLLPKEARFKGYKLDPAGNPTFAIQLGTQTLLDSWHAEKESLVRTLTLVGGTTPLPFPMPQLPEDSKLKTTLENSVTDSGNHGAATLLTLAPGKPTTITYRWK